MDQPAGIAAALQVFLALIWLAFKKSDVVNHIFTIYLPDKAALDELAGKINLRFAPGLLDAVQSDTPPTIAYYKTLPSPGKAARKTMWVMYLLVLEKLGCRNLIYIGSATDSINGCYPRWSNYDGLKQLPVYVQEAIDEGYTITHKGWLCQTPLPSGGSQPAIRALFKALEAMFTFVLWAIRAASSDGWGSMRAVCQWPAGSFEYDGLCSHNPFIENVMGEHHLSAKELDEIYTEMKDRRKDYMWHYRQSIRAGDEEAYLGKSRENRANWVKKNPESVKATEKRYMEKALAEQRFVCEPCNLVFPRKPSLDRHLGRETHKKQVRKLAVLARMEAKSAGSKPAVPDLKVDKEPIETASAGFKSVVPDHAVAREPVTKPSARFKSVVPTRGKQRLMTSYFTAAKPVAEAVPPVAGASKQH